jgi:hypothetical protein
MNGPGGAGHLAGDLRVHRSNNDAEVALLESLRSEHAQRLATTLHYMSPLRQ